MGRRPKFFVEKEVILNFLKHDNLSSLARELGISRQSAHNLYVRTCGIKKNRSSSTKRHRSPQWYAEKNGVPRLGSAIGFEGEYVKYKSLKIMCQAHKVSSAWLQHQSRRLGLSIGDIRYNSIRIKVACYECGRERIRKKSEIKNRKYHFCSRKCLGRHIGEKYGWKPGFSGNKGGTK